jgi:hypothetical protein
VGSAGWQSGKGGSGPGRGGHGQNSTVSSLRLMSAVHKLQEREK